MQLYGGKHFLGYEPVYQLSSVDVLTESGLFQHGEVIDVAENGLIVDFHCSEQRAQFVSYDNIFDASVAHCTSEYSSWRDELHSSPAVRENASVQALCRAHPGAPWLWYPGRLRSTVLNPLQSGLMVVEIQINGRLVMEVLPPCQVRFPPNQKDLSRRALHPNHFVARECRVPENYGSTVTPAIDAGFRHSFSEAQRAHIVPVLDRNCEKLKYVQRSDGRPLTEDEVNLDYEAALADVAYVEGPFSNVRTTEKRRTCGDDSLPAVECVLPTERHLLREIFDAFDSVSREPLRRVCWLWDQVLMGADSRRTVRVSFSWCDFFYPPEAYRFLCAYGAVAGMLRCINSATERLIIEDNGEEVEDVLAVVNWMLRRGHFNIQQLIFHCAGISCNCGHWSMQPQDVIEKEMIGAARVFDEDGWMTLRPLAAALRSLSPFCREFRLRQCRLYSNKAHEVTGLLTAEIPCATIQLNVASGIEEQLWDVYEEHLPRNSMNGAKVTEAIRTGSERLRRIIAQTLDEYQSRDPRLTTQYRGREWTVENLSDLDVSKLTSITLQALKEVPAKDSELAEEWNNLPGDQTGKEEA